MPNPAAPRFGSFDMCQRTIPRTYTAKPYGKYEACRDGYLIVSLCHNHTGSHPEKIHPCNKINSDFANRVVMIHFFNITPLTSSGADGQRMNINSLIMLVGNACDYHNIYRRSNDTGRPSPRIISSQSNMLRPRVTP